jgi:hypothetical protein
VRTATAEQKLVAHQIVALATRAGFLENEPCTVCGDPYAVAHHEDYFKPLDVTFLCHKHHTLRHTELRKLEEFELAPIPSGWLLVNQLVEKFGLSPYWFHSHKHHFKTARFRRNPRGTKGRLIVSEKSVREFLGEEVAL